MWFITHGDPTQILYLKQRTTSIGRKEPNDLVFADLSLSREHALLILDKDSLSVEDRGSKYGTYINGKQSGAESVTLKDGDRVLFGKFESEVLVHHVNIKPSSSMLDIEKKKKLKRILNTFGMELSEDWDETCTHLTMPMYCYASHKLIQALVMCKPIVNPKYWIAFQHSVDQNEPLPKYLNFLPKVTEDNFIKSDSVSLAINESRRKLFHGKTFYFVTTSDMQMYEDVIRKAGGKPVAMSHCRLSVQTCSAKNSIVIQKSDNASSTESQNDSTLDKIKATLVSKQLRMVPDIEIGLAVMHNSIERWCNTNISSITTLFFDKNSTSQLKIAESKILVPASLQVGESSKTQLTEANNSRSQSIVVNLNDSDDDSYLMVSKEKFSKTNEYLTSNCNVPEPIHTESVRINVLETQESLMETQTRGGSDNVPGSCKIESQLLPAVTSKHSLRKRKILEELVSSPANNPQKEPETKRKRLTYGDSDDLQTRTKHSKKRPADKANVSELFEFTALSKKAKISQTGDELLFQTSTIVPYSISAKISSISHVEVSKDHDDSSDSGVWLSKAMLAVNISDFKVKSEIDSDILRLSDSTEDIKPTSMKMLFNIVDRSSGFNFDISSMVSSRKQFVKKNNFKPQRQIVTMKLIKVSETFADLADF